MNTAFAVSQNGLLASLNYADYCLVDRHCRKVTLNARQRLQTAYHPVDFAYFPLNGLISYVAVAGASRREAEVGMIGCEGMTGTAILSGTDRAPYNVFAQVPGEALSISAADLRSCLEQSSALRASLLRFIHVMGIQCACSVVAAAEGRLEERAARWLLMAQDRLQSDVLPVTHEVVAWMLGVRRAGITLSLHVLQDKGHIGIQRKKIVVLDRAGLEKCANSLYGLPEQEYKRLIGCYASYPMSATEASISTMGNSSVMTDPHRGSQAG